MRKSKPQERYIEARFILFTQKSLHDTSAVILKFQLFTWVLTPSAPDKWLFSCFQWEPRASRLCVDWHNPSTANVPRICFQTAFCFGRLGLEDCSLLQFCLSLYHLLLSGKGSFSFSQEFQLALSQFLKNLALEIHPSIKWYCNLVLER